MQKERRFEISVGSERAYTNLIAEIIFKDKKLGLILSQERSKEDIDVSVFSLIDNCTDHFYNSDRVDDVTIDIDTLIEAINEAKERLRLLDVPRE
ncbi:hypothetical protein [Mesorhizobium sp. 113-3-3]|uniref:hypothetical protein n=1 Tax=Mesorhizobium sp. 113-3-3 TaxID=2744516 RepID=UPI001927AA56|nr:hypothetical protein [Mesorhizobium sp. 113-3-3]BCG82305.1 hypothetical protein MesoLj113b_58470 [Mesorhizobium sp. 113-3-3]